MNVRQKLLLSNLAIVFFILVLGITSIVSARNNNAQVKTVEQMLAVDNALTNQIRRGITQLDDITYELQTAPSNFSESSTSEIMKICSDLETNVAKLCSSAYQNEVQSLRGAVATWTKEAKGKFLDAMRSGDENAINVIYNDMTALHDKAMETASAIGDGQIKDIIDEVKILSDSSTTIVVTVVTILAVIFALSISAKVSKEFIGKLNVAMKTASTIAKGNLKDPVPENYGTDEFSKLLKALETMRSTWQALVGDIKLQINNASQKISEIKENTNRIDEVSKSALNKSVTIAAAANQMYSTTADIARNCETSSAQAQSTKENNHKCVDQISQTIDAIREQVKKSSTDMQKVNELAEETDKIGLIVQTIDDIAAQTNLLALNAAIEAARAGEAGKGFAVVADEVRALAQRTSSSTSEIENMVGKIQSDAKEANESMTVSVENMKTLEEKASIVEGLLQSITDDIDAMTDQIAQISAASTQQTAATGEISANMQGINNAIEMISSDLDHTDHEVENSVNSLNVLLEKVASIRN